MPANIKFSVSGPDVWLFPDIDGCYAVRKSPKRWKNERSRVIEIYGRNGHLLGEYSERETFLTNANKVVYITRACVMGNEVKYHMTLKNAVRYCYLITQQVSKDNEMPSFAMTDQSCIFSNNGLLVAVYVTHGIQLRPCYEIYNKKGRTVGFVEVGKCPLYYPTDKNASIEMKNKNSTFGIKFESTKAIQESIGIVFSFINEQENKRALLPFLFINYL